MHEHTSTYVCLIIHVLMCACERISVCMDMMICVYICMYLNV